MNRKLLLWIVTLMLLALVLGACAPAATPTLAPAIDPTAAPTSAPANFPTGKFIKSGTTNHGLIFNEHKPDCSQDHDNKKNCQKYF